MTSFRSGIVLNHYDRASHRSQCYISHCGGIVEKHNSRRVNYSGIQIDWLRGNNLVSLTRGQLEFVRKEIELQKQGYGFIGRGKSYEEYLEYWLDLPGTPVRQIVHQSIVFVLFCLFDYHPWDMWYNKSKL